MSHINESRRISMSHVTCEFSSLPTKRWIPQLRYATFRTHSVGHCPRAIYIHIHIHGQYIYPHTYTRTIYISTYIYTGMPLSAPTQSGITRVYVYIYVYVYVYTYTAQHSTILVVPSHARSQLCVCGHWHTWVWNSVYFWPKNPVFLSFFLVNTLYYVCEDEVKTYCSQT